MRVGYVVPSNEAIKKGISPITVESIKKSHPEGFWVETKEPEGHFIQYWNPEYMYPNPLGPCGKCGATRGDSDDDEGDYLCRACRNSNSF